MFCTHFFLFKAQTNQLIRFSKNCKFIVREVRVFCSQNKRWIQAGVIGDGQVKVPLAMQIRGLFKGLELV